jgi:uncharacterized protein YhfF
MTMPSASHVVEELAACCVVLPAGRVFLDRFGDSAELSRSLIALIRAGKKRAGASLLWAHEHEREPVPMPGDIGIILDDRHRPVMVTRVTHVETVPFRRVTAAYAALEGESDGSLERWSEGHWAFFTRECEAIGRTPDESMPIVCSVFEVVEVQLRRLEGAQVQ